MRKKRLIITGSIMLLIAVAVLAVSHSVPKWSELSFEAVVQETVIQPDGEIRLIVQRTTEIYANPLNSLHIVEETVLCDANGVEMQIEDFLPGNVVKVTCENAFVEETPFYYPTVYEIRVIDK